METRVHLAVTEQQALRFFFEHLRDVTEPSDPPVRELLYNASVLAHFASTSTASCDVFPPSPTTLSTVFDVFVLDQSQSADAEVMEAAAAQCLLLTGFFLDQQKARHQVEWFAMLGASFYLRAAAASRDRTRRVLMTVMAERFGYWRQQQHRLAIELREAPLLINVPTGLVPPAAIV
jgi:hypothetical protein